MTTLYIVNLVDLKL